MKKIALCLLTLFLLISLVSCDYVSSYSAIGLVRVTKENHSSVSFKRLDGTLVLKPNFTAASEGAIHYSVLLEEGELNIYHISLGNKSLLANVKAGEAVEDIGGYVERGRQTIIIETVTPSKGSVTIDFEYYIDN